MIKLKISEIGTPQIRKTKFGDKEHNSIKVEGEWAGKYLGYFTNESTKKWKVGDEIDVESVEKKDYTNSNGELKTAYNLKLPQTGFAEVLKRIEELENKYTKLAMRVSALEPKKETDIYKTHNIDENPPEPNFDNPPF